MNGYSEKYIDSDNNINYETNSFSKNIINFFLIPTLNSLPKFLKVVVKKTHKSAGDIIKYKTSHKALEILYNKGNLPKDKENILKKIFRNIWFNTNNSKAVRNRLKAVKRELNLVGQKILDNKTDLKIFSIASGSARAIIETAANLQIPNERKIYVSFLDKSSEAIEYSKAKVKEINFDNNCLFDWHIDTASNFGKYFKYGNPNIIEMVGLLDYFDNEKALNIFRIIYNNLEDGGTFITANIDDNKERRFITNFLDWKMVYKNADELKKLALQAGFKKDNIKIFYEPLKIHVVLIAKK